MTTTKYSTEHFTWRAQDIDSAFHLSFQGELDFQNVRFVSAALREFLAGRDTTVVLDLADVSFIDSSGLGLLIRTKKEVEAVGGRLIVSRASPVVKRLIDVTRLNAWFDPVDDPPSTDRCPVCEQPMPSQTRICGTCRSAL